MTDANVVKLVEHIPGISLRLFRGDTGVDLRKHNEGCVGRLEPNERFLLLLKVLPRDGIIRTVFTLNQEGGLVPLRAEHGFHRHGILISSAKDGGTPYAKYPSNHIRVLEVTLGGKIRMWEVALVSERGTGFLTTQMTYQATCYRGPNEEVVCPLTEHSAPVTTAIKHCLGKRTAGLPSIENYRPTQDIRHTSLLALPPGNFGLVIWWNEAMRMGMMRTSEGKEVRVLGSKIRTGRQYRTFLIPGEVVEFQKLQPTPQGSLTKFEIDAVGVTM